MQKNAEYGFWIKCDCKLKPMFDRFKKNTSFYIWGEGGLKLSRSIYGNLIEDYYWKKFVDCKISFFNMLFIPKSNQDWKAISNKILRLELHSIVPSKPSFFHNGLFQNHFVRYHHVEYVVKLKPKLSHQYLVNQKVAR